MAVQVSYPGVYIEEFAPGAPIQGVGTNTAAFIGTTTRGPFEKPTLIQSWDAFVATFGDFPPGPSASYGYLAPAVFGFFLNGGTTCYVVRAGTGKQAIANLPSRQPGNNPKPILVIRATQEGPAGDNLSVNVDDESSRLAALLADAVSQRNIMANPTQNTLTLDSIEGYAAGEMVVVAKQNSPSRTVVIATTQPNGTITLAANLPAGVDYSGGTLSSAGILAIRRAETQAAVISTDRRELTVGDTKGFARDDRILLKQGNNESTAIVASVAGATTLVLTAPVPSTINFTPGPVSVRSADLLKGQRVLRLAVPAGLLLNQALPQGTAVSIRRGNTSEIRIVESSGGDTITLAEGLSYTYSLSTAANPPTVASLEFDLIVNDPAQVQPISFPQLAMHPSHPNYWGIAVASDLFTIAEPDEPLALAPEDLRPKKGTYQLSGGQVDDRAAGWTAIGNNPQSYLDRLKPYDEIALVCIPGATDTAVQQAIRDHCELMHDRFAILDSKLRATPGNGIRDQFAAVRSRDGFAALYYPWIEVRNPLTGRNELWPPSGHISGVYARTDQERGVHKAPANVNIRGTIGLERRLTDEEQGPLNLLGVNVLRMFADQSQPMVWGARTTATDRNWQYINVRRLFLFLEESIQEDIRWAVFEPNNLQLWQKLKRTITEFLTRVWRDGALFGATAAEAFYVRIDEKLNPDATRRLGRLYIEIGAQPAYTAEFIIVRIGIWQGGAEVSEG